MAIGAWRSYALAREALRPMIHDGDPTRTAIETTRSFPFRPRVQRAARILAASIGWLLVAFYGLYLVVSSQVATR